MLADSLVENFVSFFGDLFAVLGALLTIFAGLYAFIRARWMKDSKRAVGLAFRETIEGLSSDKAEIRTASAIILRRFLDEGSEYGVGGAPFRHEAISIATALLKSSSAGEVQKILCEILPLAKPEWLKEIDLQRANLSNAYLAHIEIEEGDFFQAHIVSASFKGAKLSKCKFREAIIRRSSFRGADLRGSVFDGAHLEDIDFRGADLRGVSFNGAEIRNVDTTGATLDSRTSGAIEPGLPNAATRTRVGDQDLKVFLSRPSRMNERQDGYFRLVRRAVEARNLHVVELPREDYSPLGSLGAVVKAVDASHAMIAFGFGDYTIHHGAYRQFDLDGREIRDENLASPWCQIEAGMALQKGIPLLVVADPGVHEGIFEPHIADRLVQHVELRGQESSLLKGLNEWVDHHFSVEEFEQAPMRHRELSQKSAV
ncbi:pentapeptide repeat-containing protein [Limimaricola cinnabarinus]|uniref:pentapeptide repeat-containing protein n=1 Tax=Limimaricola cinnabarinus TaxID=1125964 RepID=UPI002491D3D0|nr:pentapeptide repeat-containing protein [Limimaricola cinnabarinus]